MGRADGLTEDGWLRAKNPGLLLDFARKSASHRRVRLATVGICRAAWPLLPPSLQPQDADCLALLDLSERYADGGVKQTELMVARRSLAGPDVPRGGPEDRKVAAVWFASAKDPAKTCTEAAFRLLGVSWGGTGELDMPAEYLRDRFGRGSDWVAACMGMLVAIRDVFGNPFRPVAFDPVWRNSTIFSLASQMYETRDFSAMPILADALQDAGCDNEDVLNHCRGDGLHVRGCWVVDLVLGNA